MRKLFKKIFSIENIEPTEDEIIDHLILEGALRVVGINKEDGSFMYSLTTKIKEVMPELYAEHLRSLNADTMQLWEKGFLDIDFFVDDPLISLSDKAFVDYEVDSLDLNSKYLIQEIKRLSK